MRRSSQSNPSGRHASLGAASAAAGLAISLTASGQAVYGVIDLGDLGGGSASARAISASGTVVGQARDGLGRDRAFLKPAGGAMVDLGTLGGASGIANDINAGGTVVGSAQNAGGVQQAFMWDQTNGIRPVPGPSSLRISAALGVNESGRIVGSLFNSIQLERAYIADPSLGLVDPFPTFSAACVASAVNASGQITGHQLFGSNLRGYLWTDGSSIQTGGGPGYGLNSGGQVVGQTGIAAYRWTPPDTYTVLPTGVVEPRLAYAINDSGMTVGSGVNGAGRSRGFLHSPIAGLRDLNEVIPASAGLEITEARDIDASGRIVGTALDSAARTRAVLLTPPPRQPVLYVKADAAAGGNGTSWATAYRSLEDALTAASVSDGVVREIWVAASVYKPVRRVNPLWSNTATFQLVRNVELYGGFEGTETSREQRDWALHPTVLSGDLNGDDGPVFTNYEDNAWHVVTATLTPDDATAVLDGFVVTAGNASGNGPDSAGAGLVCAFGSAQVRHTVFRSNSANRSAAGASSTSSRSRFEDCQFIRNRSYGGAGAMFASFRAVIDGCTFTDNQVPNSGGAAGALSVTGFVVVSSCRFTGNSTVSGSGGAVLLDEAGTMINCVVVGNSAGGIGGGVNAGPATLILNCLINGNSAGDRGGGVAGGGRLFNCTLTHNSAGASAGGFYGTQTPTIIRNCVVWGNTAAGLPGERHQIDGVNPVISYCTSQYWTGLLGGEGNSGSLPRFVDADGADNVPGTIDDNLRLEAPLSPCIDSGDNNALPPDTTDLDEDGDRTEPLPLDLDRATRAVDEPGAPNTGLGPGPMVDRGCYEAQLPMCYANCDGSTTPPVLNVNDFICFQSRFAAGAPYADCDHSGTLNVNDFVCFQGTFAAGCR